MYKNGILMELDTMSPTGMEIYFIHKDIKITKVIDNPRLQSYKFMSMYTNENGESVIITLHEHKTYEKPIRLGTMLFHKENDITKDIEFIETSYSSISEAIKDGKYCETQLNIFRDVYKKIKTTFNH